VAPAALKKREERLARLKDSGTLAVHYLAWRFCAQFSTWLDSHSCWQVQVLSCSFIELVVR
jgi:hypothetical protein